MEGITLGTPPLSDARAIVLTDMCTWLETFGRAHDALLTPELTCETANPRGAREVWFNANDSPRRLLIACVIKY